jgi:hypothetical protein
MLTAMDSVDAASAHLLDLRSVDCRLTIRVVSRYGPGIPGPHDDLQVEFAAEAGPFSMATPDIVSRDELADWAECLDQLASGETAVWRDSGRSLALAFAPLDGGVQVTVTDEPSSGAELVLSIYPDSANWIAEQRELLNGIEMQFPAESIESSPGVWTWARR